MFILSPVGFSHFDSIEVMIWQQKRTWIIVESKQQTQRLEKEGVNAKLIYKSQL